MPNVEFSHIIVDKGMFHDHMPDTVQEALENLHKQLFDDNPPSVHYHHNNTEPDGVEDTIRLEMNETPEVNGHTIEVEVENNLQPDQEESTFV